MSCLYSDNEGVCYFYDKDEYGLIKNVIDTDYGFVEAGICVVDEDPDPMLTCSSYEPVDPSEDEE